MTKVYTAENLTDAEIRDAMERRDIPADLAVETGARLSGGMWYAPAAVRAVARASVAKILNALSALSLLRQGADYIAKCDNCEERARKRDDHPCPDHWFYLESVRQSDRSVYIVWACSETCRDALWKRGPGPANIDEDASRRAIDRQTRKAVR